MSTSAHFGALPEALPCLLMTVLLLAACLSFSDPWSPGAADPWAPVKTILDNFQNLTDCADCNCKGCHGFTFTAGDSSGQASFRL